MVNESKNFRGMSNSELSRTSSVKMNIHPNNKISSKCTKLKFSPALSQGKENTFKYPSGKVFNQKVKESTSPTTLYTNLSSKYKKSYILYSHIISNLIIFYQNICSLRTKTSEILCHFSSNLPHILCFTEHHLSVPELQAACIDNYTLSTYYCRKQALKGGVCIFIKK
jgi:hypothetical protein